jgi:NAD(P)-dependent dehydrogenase (short-subunit alcohol dehydrogenase family)
MKELRGKVAVITGSGSGIGRGTALALADAGMHIVVADIDEGSARNVADEVEARGVQALVVATDVRYRAATEALADSAYSQFGAVHVLHNNAGVCFFSRIHETSDEDWSWMLSINLQGVINGLQAFLPRMKSAGDESHIVNTASMSGMLSSPGLGTYSATKFAVVTISETLRAELAADRIGVSVLCPGAVNTNLLRGSAKQRPGGTSPGTSGRRLGSRPEEQGPMRLADPEDVGRMVLLAIENNEPYIFTHPEMKAAVSARFDRILAAFDEVAIRMGVQESGPITADD